MRRKSAAENISQILVIIHVIRVQALIADPPLSMSEGTATQREPDMGCDPSPLAKEEESARWNEKWIANGPAPPFQPRFLIPGVARQGESVEFMHHLRETRAVEAMRALAAPDLGNAGEPTGGGQEGPRPGRAAEGGGAHRLASQQVARRQVSASTIR